MLHFGVVEGLQAGVAHVNGLRTNKSRYLWDIILVQRAFSILGGRALDS